MAEGSATPINKKFSLREWWKDFTTYEKWWLILLSILAVVMAIIFPEDDANGYSGLLITVLYLLDVLIGNLCELLIAKQIKWGVLLYDVVEVIEIAVMIMLRARFASLAVAMFYWIPAHTLGFWKWDKNRDKNNEKITSVRGLKPWHAVLMIVICVIWTAVIGYLVVRFSPET
ncbi:MAG: nicotinamide mononucleotide transporter, partial [Firmicutes bacterium]|nr:nicotinamide mononucleotide transporter [Bacillota bacterium]